jgi:hypothetical protein
MQMRHYRRMLLVSCTVFEFMMFVDDGLSIVTTRVFLSDLKRHRNIGVCRRGSGQSDFHLCLQGSTNPRYLPKSGHNFDFPENLGKDDLQSLIERTDKLDVPSDAGNLLCSKLCHAAPDNRGVGYRIGSCSSRARCIPRHLQNTGQTVHSHRPKQ